MALTTVIINDFTNNQRRCVILDNKHYDAIAAVWDKEDSILVEMQDNDFFAGRRKWCDLNPTHFRLMVARNLTMVAELPDEDKQDLDNIVVKSLNLLLTGLVFCLQQRSECLVELLRVGRLSESEVMYEYSASLNMAIDVQRPKSGLRVIVNNE